MPFTEELIGRKLKIVFKDFSMHDFNLTSPLLPTSYKKQQTPTPHPHPPPPINKLTM